MKCNLFLLIFFLSVMHSFAQHRILPTEHPIYLADSIDNSYYEFSGIAKWRNYVLLIPQHRSATDNYHIVCVDTASIDSVIHHKTIFAAKTKKLLFDNSLETIYDAIKQAILPRNDFGGFEGAVVVGDNIFLTVETDSLCYVVKGNIDGSSNANSFQTGRYHVAAQTRLYFWKCRF